MTSEQLTLLVDTVQQLSMARSLEAVMTIVRKAARKLTGADGATFVLRDNDRCYYADEDAIGPLWKGQRFPMSACVSGWAMINRRPAIIPDIYNDPRIPLEAYRITFVKSMVIVPIRTLEPIGAIGNYWADAHTPADEEVQLLQSLADMTSVSIENVYMYLELEERVRQRTAELEQANKELEAFSFSVSHDLRTPLRGMIGRMQLMLDEYAEQLSHPEVQQTLGWVVKRATGMHELIERLLDFSRSVKKPLSDNELPVHQMVEEICHEFRELERDRVIRFEISELPDTRGDFTLIRQVWVNLISNAVKYSSYRPEAIITIGAQPAEDETTYFVKDNGAGFDMKYYDKLFGIFQRLHGEAEFKGTGIGLALVQGILVRHGGQIWAEGRVNEGAEFYFTLPNPQGRVPRLQNVQAE